MWHNNKKVRATHAKDGSKMAWAVITDMSGWKRIKTTSVDGVTNLHLMLSIACANDRMVDVFLDGDEITQVTLK